MDLFPSLTLDLWSVLLLMGCLHGWFLCLILVLGGHRVKLILAGLIFVLSYGLFLAFLWQSTWIIHLPHLVATSMPSLFLVGPLYYWFFSALLQKKPSIPWWHLLPALVCFLTIIPFYAQSIDFKIDYILSKDVSVVSLPPTRAIYFGLLFLQLAFYWAQVHRLRQPGEKSDGRTRQKVRGVHHWLRIFHYAFGLFLGVFFVSYLLLTLSPWNYGEIRYAAHLSLALVVHTIGYYTIRHASVFSYLKITEAPHNFDKSLKNRILHSMEREKPFLDQDLTLAKFSENLNASPSVVSQLINMEFNCNFSDFINQYRVKEAKKLLADARYRHYKLEAIGYEAGFRNKVNFNRVFKKHTGVTPSTVKAD